MQEHPQTCHFRFNLVSGHSYLRGESKELGKELIEVGKSGENRRKGSIKHYRITESHRITEW